MIAKSNDGNYFVVNGKNKDGKYILEHWEIWPRFTMIAKYNSASISKLEFSPSDKSFLFVTASSAYVKILAVDHHILDEVINCHFLS